MSKKIIEPSEDYCNDFNNFIKNRYGAEEFSISDAANSHFQFRYNTTDNWTDSKNVTGYVKRMSELGDTYEFVGFKVNPATGRKNKFYKRLRKWKSLKPTSTELIYEIEEKDREIDYLKNIINDLKRGRLNGY